MLVLSSRGVVQSMNWVRDNADDPEIQVDAEKAKKAFVGRELKGKRIGVIGFGVSNQPLVRVLLRSGCDVTVCDRRERAQLGAAGDEAAAQGAKFVLGTDYLDLYIIHSFDYETPVEETMEALDALVLECTDLSAFSAPIQRAINLPVYDINSLVEYAYYAVCRKDY